MELIDIDETMTISTGEYLFHEPSSQIVICGQRGSNLTRLKALGHGRIIEDTIDNFKKIQLTPEERKVKRASRCKGCGA
jgi:hypothetical protein